jgi:cystine transport system substrate-binding protein
MNSVTDYGNKERNNTMKKTMQWTGLLIARSSILLSACGQQDEKATGYDKIQKEGTIVVATAGIL